MCALKNLTTHNNGSCFPWDMPTIQKDTPLCDGYRAYQFYKAYKSYKPLEDPNCDCLPDCEKTTFKSEIATVRLRDEMICNYISSDFSPPLDTEYGSPAAMGAWRFNGGLPSMYHRDYVYARLIDPDERKLVRFSKWGRDDKYFEQLCYERYSSFYAYLIVQIREPNVVQVARNVKVTFSEKLGIAGGTIGLFTGLSFISVIEIGYWLIRFVLERIWGISKANKPNDVVAIETGEEDTNRQTPKAWTITMDD